MLSSYTPDFTFDQVPVWHRFPGVGWLGQRTSKVQGKYGRSCQMPLLRPHQQCTRGLVRPALPSEEVVCLLDSDRWAVALQPHYHVRFLLWQTSFLCLSFRCLFLWRISSYPLVLFSIYLFGLHQVLVAAHGILVAACGLLSCGMWDLVPQPGIEPQPPALGARSLTHWATREFSPLLFFICLFLLHF